MLLNAQYHIKHLEQTPKNKKKSHVHCLLRSTTGYTTPLLQRKTTFLPIPGTLAKTTSLSKTDNHMRVPTTSR